MNDRPCELARRTPERRPTTGMVLVVAALLIVLVPSTGSSSQSAERGALAFVSDRDGVASVYVINADGKGLRRLIRNATEPRWAPDGQRLAFLRGGVLHVLTLRGLRERRLAAAHSFDWSPDSRRIVYSAGGIHVVGRDGRETRRLTTASDGRVAWSPDGSRIAFVRETANSPTLFVMSINGSQRRRLATDVPYAGGPVWSPDGKELAVAREENGDELLVVVGVADGKQRVLIRKGFEAAWSPDGSRIAATGLIGGTTRTTIVKPDGTRVAQLAACCSAPSWSPDSRTVAVAGGEDLWVASADGTATARIIHADYESDSPQWHPRAKATASIGGIAVSKAVPTDSRQVGRTLETRSRIDLLAADGTRVAIGYSSVPNCLELWSPLTHKLVRIAEQACFSEERGGEAMSIFGLALADSRLAWAVAMETHHTYEAISTATEARPWIEVGYSAELDVEHVGPPFGDGSLLVFESWRESGRGTLWRLRGKRAVRLRGVTGAPSLLAVDDGRIVRRGGAYPVEVLRADGTPLASFVITGGHPESAALDGNRLAVLGQASLALYDLERRTRTRSWPVSPRGGKLAGLQNGIAVVVAGRRISLVRVSDGKTAVIRAGGGKVHAQLEPAGLFYSHSAPRGGRVAFVPMGELQRRIR